MSHILLPVILILVLLTACTDETIGLSTEIPSSPTPLAQQTSLPTKTHTPEPVTLTATKVVPTDIPIPTATPPPPPTESEVRVLIELEFPAEQYSTLMSAPYRQDNQNKYLVVVYDTVNFCPNDCLVLMDGILLAYQANRWQVDRTLAVKAELFPTRDNPPYPIVVQLG
ncbi:MAG: hypothetical protein AAF485_21290, partial [Chloroflexota bacterium]